MTHWGTLTLPTIQSVALFPSMLLREVMLQMLDCLNVTNIVWTCYFVLRLLPLSLSHQTATQNFKMVTLCEQV